jgi:hypothetical protein
MSIQVIKRYIDNVIAMADCIKLKLPGRDKEDVQVTKRQYVGTIPGTSTVNATNSTTGANSTNTTTVTNIITMSKGVKAKLS